MQITAILRFLTMLCEYLGTGCCLFYIILQLPTEGVAQKTIYWQSQTSARHGLNTAVVRG
jgi:hypothetical protein